MAGNGSSKYSANNSGPDAQAALGQWTGTTNTTLNHVLNLHFFDYSQTNKHKQMVYRNSASAAATEAGAIRFASTSALTTFRIYLASTTFIAGSTFALYGVSA